MGGRWWLGRLTAPPSMTFSVALLPPQQGVLFDEPSHRYWVWSPRRNAWLQPRSTSAVLTRSGIKGFDPFYWRRSLIEKRKLRPDEAESYMELHREERADIGTELHGLIRAELLGQPYHSRCAESLLLLAVWREMFLPRIEAVVAIETPMVSLAYFVSGTPDLVARVDGAWMTLDWKSKVSEEKAKPEAGWKPQLGGYDLMIEEHHGIRLDGALNLMIWPEGTKDVWYNRADVNQAREEFLGAAAWSHAIDAADGCPVHRGALEHLLTLHPEALEWIEAPKGHGPWTIERALRAPLAQHP